MILYFKPGACSLAPHIILKEMQLDFDKDEVNTDEQVTISGKDYRLINANGYVPSLALGTGEVLTEGVSIMQYLADQQPEKGLAPPVGSVQRARLQEYLNFTSSELHKSFSPLFSSSSTSDEKQQAKKNVAKHFDYLEQLFADGREYLLGDQFSVADAYLFVVANWSNFVGIDFGHWSKLKAFIERVLGRKATQSAMRAERLISE